jgi:hypothetical protein
MPNSALSASSQHSSGKVFLSRAPTRRDKMAAKVFIVSSESQADYKVFFVDSESRQKNYQIIADGKLVDSESQADVKVFIVQSESKASICIMRKHFAKK